MTRSTLAALAALALWTAIAAAAPVGFQRVTVPDTADKPHAVGIWYPTAATPSPQTLGPYEQTVAIDGAPSGTRLPLIVILHGQQGVFENHFHTALALAEAGFVVASVGQAADMPFVERSRHVGRALDYLLGAWPHHRAIDAARIGIYGFSVGGFTALVTLGATPDMTRVAPSCAQHEDRVCGVLKDRAFDPAIPASAWTRVSSAGTHLTFGPRAPRPHE